MQYIQHSKIKNLSISRRIHTTQLWVFYSYLC